MKRQISFRQYRAIDLGLMALLLLLSQGAISIAAATVFSSQLYIVSTVGAVTALVMMRWNGWAAVHAVLGGVFYAWLAGGNAQQMFIYGAGNALSLTALVLFRWPGKEKLRGDALSAMFFGAWVQIFMLLGRALIALLLGYPGGACISFITTDALSILFTVCVVWVCRRIEGLFEDQKNYLLRIQNEANAEGREKI